MFTDNNFIIILAIIVCIVFTVWFFGQTLLEDKSKITNIISAIISISAIIFLTVSFVDMSNTTAQRKDVKLVQCKLTSDRSSTTSILIYQENNALKKKWIKTEEITVIPETQQEKVTLYKKKGLFDYGVVRVRVYVHKSSLK